jgi:hypothetical protein
MEGETRYGKKFNKVSTILADRLKKVLTEKYSTARNSSRKENVETNYITQK